MTVKFVMSTIVFFGFSSLAHGQTQTQQPPNKTLKKPPQSERVIISRHPVYETPAYVGRKIIKAPYNPETTRRQPARNRAVTFEGIPEDNLLRKRMNTKRKVIKRVEPIPTGFRYKNETEVNLEGDSVLHKHGSRLCNHDHLISAKTTTS